MSETNTPADSPPSQDGRVLSPAYETIEAAAARLGITPEALRARCRRYRRRPGANAVAELGAGIRAVKFGRSWRVRFPKDERP